MLSQIDYYKAPSDQVFSDIREAATLIWNTYDNQFGYVTEKLNYINKLENIQDNATYMVGMFDHWNRIRLLSLPESKNPEAVAYLKERM